MPERFIFFKKDTSKIVYLFQSSSFSLHLLSFSSSFIEHFNKKTEFLKPKTQLSQRLDLMSFLLLIHLFVFFCQSQCQHCKVVALFGISDELIYRFKHMCYDILG